MLEIEQNIHTWTQSRDEVFYIKERDYTQVLPYVTVLRGTAIWICNMIYNSINQCENTSTYTTIRESYYDYSK